MYLEMEKLSFMNRRNFIQITTALISGTLIFKSFLNSQKTLCPAFKYLGEATYSYDKPGWVDSTGKGHYMMNQHSIHLTIKEADDPNIVKRNRIHTARQARESRQHHEKSDLAVVVYENWEADKIGLNYKAALDPESLWYNKVYNSARFFLIDRKTLEKDIWS